jgi:hypothetical protein
MASTRTSPCASGRASRPATSPASAWGRSPSRVSAGGRQQGTTLAAPPWLRQQQGAASTAWKRITRMRWPDSPRSWCRPVPLPAQLVASEGEVLCPGAPGVDITMTIDAGLQLALEQGAAGSRDRGSREERVGRRPRPLHGRHLRGGELPSYDANNYQKTAAKDPSIFIDPVVARSTRPGSVLEMITAVATPLQGRRPCRRRPSATRAS